MGHSRGQEMGVLRANYHFFLVASSHSIRNIVGCRGDKNFSYSWKVSIALQLASALELMHARKLIHGDVKITNVLIGDDDLVYFCDIGSAASIGDPPPSDHKR